MRVADKLVRTDPLTIVAHYLYGFIIAMAFLVLALFATGNLPDPVTQLHVEVPASTPPPNTLTDLRCTEDMAECWDCDTMGNGPCKKPPSTGELAA